MQHFREKALAAKWKSYKTFEKAGGIRLHSAALHRELVFTDDGLLTLTEYRKGIAETVLQTRQWTVELNNKRHYLKIPERKWTFEIITVNHTVLVLLDHSSWEKTFFTREQSWPAYLQSNTEMTL